MQTILGAGGQIASELARELKLNFTSDIRLVSRRPTKVNESDELLSADLLDATQTKRAVDGSQVVYLTVGLPMDTESWITRWPIFMRNAIDACAAHGAKLVFFDNTYMYPQTAHPQTEETQFRPNGKKGKVRGAIARDLMDAIEQGRVEGMICRAPEFYGSGKTQSITNSMVISRLLAGKHARVFLSDQTLRTLIYTPDASRAMALLGNTHDAYGQTWHLPCDDNRFTYRQFIELAAVIFGKEGQYEVLKKWKLWLASITKQNLREVWELLPRYASDNIFVSDKFKKRFPDFRVTTFQEGLRTIARPESSTI